QRRPAAAHNHSRRCIHIIRRRRVIPPSGIPPPDRGDTDTDEDTGAPAPRVTRKHTEEKQRDYQRCSQPLLHRQPSVAPYERTSRATHVHHTLLGAPRAARWAHGMAPRNVAVLRV